MMKRATSTNTSIYFEYKYLSFWEPDVGLNNMQCNWFDVLAAVVEVILKTK